MEGKAGDKKYYTVGDLKMMFGITRKALFYYDKNGLLQPSFREGSGKYKAYSNDEVERLRNILKYREAGLQISEIREILDSPNPDILMILKKALTRAYEERESKLNQIHLIQTMIKDLS